MKIVVIIKELTIILSITCFIQDTINGVDAEKKTPFFWACQEGRLEIAELFIDLRCDFDKVDSVSYK